MKQIRTGTLHLSGHDNHLYGLCDGCLGVRHLGVLGGEYNLIPWGEKWGLVNKWTARDPQTVLNEDIKSDPYSIPEAYNFELVGIQPYWIFDPENIRTPCQCEFDRLQLERSSGMKFQEI